MNQPLRRLIPQARTLITKESFRDQSFGNLDGYIEDLPRPIDLAPLVRVVQKAMQMFPPRDEKSDGWLAPRVHASLRLFRSEAADQGIWDYLSAVILRDYIIWRMADEDGSVNDIDRIIGPFRHQAVARLWWAAELSRNGADYRPTEEAFNSQDAVNYLTNVEAFHNRPAALAYIRFISHKGIAKPIKQRAIETGKTLNHVLTTIVLDSFAPDSGSDMVANERWITKSPEVILENSVLPQGPDEPPVPEEKIFAVEQLLERLMEEHRWKEIVDWSQQWIAKAQSPKLAETALPRVEVPGGNGSKDIAAQDTGLYERFAQALTEDLGVEPSDQTRELFDQVANELDPSHNPDGSTRFAARPVEEWSKDQAMVETAERVYDELSLEQQALARRIFLQLTELGEGTRDSARRVSIEELIPRPENALSVDAMLKMLRDAHLVTSDEGAVQIADEVLIREWKSLREWLAEDREGLRVHRHLTQSAQEWETMHRDSSLLYSGLRLAQALEWAKTNANEMSVREREFLDASNQVAEREGQSLAEAETRRAAEEHRVAMQWRQRAFYLLAGIIIVPIIVTVVVLFVR